MGWEKRRQGMGWGELYRLSISGELNRLRRSAVKEKRRLREEIWQRMGWEKA
jgi:hypothetical protein